MKKYLRVIFGLSLIVFSSCVKPEWTISTSNGDEFSNLSFQTHDLNAIVFLAPGCPLSEASIQEINNLQSKYSSNKLATFVVIPGHLYTRDEVDSFINHFNISLPVLLDTTGLLVEKLNATMTPEYVLLDKKMEVLYHGAIDNRALDNDLIRQSATINYADSAIHQYLTGQKIKFPKSNAVGCYIEL